MYHSITFGNKNTWADWHLIPSSRPVFNPPKPKTKYVDIPGANGIIDLTDTLTGGPVFSNREGSFEFYVLNDYPAYSWINVYTNILGYLHGKSMQAILEDEPGYFYEGRFTLNEWRSDKDWSKITIDYSVSPFKYPIGSVDHEGGIL